MVINEKRGYKTVFYHQKIPEQKKRVIKEQSEPEVMLNCYEPADKIYRLADLLSYNRSKAVVIKGPYRERPVINELLSELEWSTNQLSLLKPLSDLYITTEPKGFKHEVDLMQRSIFLPVAKVIDVRFEVKIGFKPINKIKDQLTNIPGNLYPVIVEQNEDVSEAEVEQRFNELHNELSNEVLGYVINDGLNFIVRLNDELIEVPQVIKEIMYYDGFNNVLERDLLITAYSIFNSIGYLGGKYKRLSFKDGLLTGGKYSFTTRAIKKNGNHLIYYNPFNSKSASCSFYQSYLDEFLAGNKTKGVFSTEPPAINFCKSAVGIDPLAPSSKVLNQLTINSSSLKNNLDGLKGLIPIRFNCRVQ